MAETGSPPEPPAPEPSGRGRKQITQGADDLPVISGRQPGLDGIRGLSCIAIVLYHVGVYTGSVINPGVFGAILSRLEVMVPIFFMLSGLFLFRPWVSAVLRDRAEPDNRAYLWRRIFRVMPAYWLVVGIGLILYAEGHRNDVGHWLQMMTASQIWNPPTWWFGTGPPALGQTWTLSVEVAFYLTLPLFAAAAGAWARRARPDVNQRAKRLLLALVPLTVASFVTVLAQFAFLENPLLPRHQLYVWLTRCWIFFAAGMAITVVAVWANVEPGPNGPIRRFCRWTVANSGTLAIFALVLYGLALHPAFGPRLVGIVEMNDGFLELTFYTVISMCLIAPVAFQSPAPHFLNRVWANRVMVYLGEVSFGFYLWHVIVIEIWWSITGQQPWAPGRPLGNLWVNYVIVVGLSLLMAHATYKFIEQPGMRLYRFVDPKRRAAPSPSPEVP